MDVISSLKKIRTQIKYGRIVEAEEALMSLLIQEKGRDQEILILEVYALELLRKVGGHIEAIPLLERLLTFPLPDELSSQANDFLSFCKKKTEISISKPNEKNSDFVEFMDTIRRKEIFTFKPNPSPSTNYITVNDIEDAKKLAWHQKIAPPFLSWNGMRTEASKQVHTHYFENKISMDFLHKDISPEIIKICEDSISSTMMIFFDDIYSDLIEIARGKLVGMITDLHQIMWDAYKEKLFPCGWKGNFPDGKLCVFIP
ncbi:hypothetical protein GJ700_30155 [Duganella sp. FT92W]|uniref:Uncharacterized protein n=1 Tax=Pseudoduganella rivuli TaxID=2666085 RepID=A0A7X2ITS0_9BURK|nr:hypothetical protein [Pseudoduganella rivuli]MRV75985.1 hypothetical protein [Pseudoduganella rivuli]